MKIKSNTITILSIFTILLAFMAISNVNVASAVTTSGSVTPSSTADFVVGKANAVYKVSFRSSTTTQTTSITIGFPVGYVITTTTIGTSNVTSIDGTPASFTLGNATSAITAVTGVTTTRAVVITMASTTLTASTTSFYILSGITNSTTSGATASSSILVSSEGVATSTAVGAVTLVMDTVLLRFTTQPAVATSGFAFVTQPIVTAQDQYANVSSTYASLITLTSSGTGTLAGGTTSTAAAGSSTFTGAQYNAITDNEVFFLTASDGARSTTSSNLTARVVATKLVFTTQPANANSGTALSTQPIVSAEDALGVVDADFVSLVTLTTTSTTAGTLSNGTATAVGGHASFGNVYYVAAVSGESFMLTASGGGLLTGDSASRIGFTSAGGSGTPYVGPAPVTTPVTTPAPVSTPTPVVSTPAAVTPVATVPVVTATSQQEQINILVTQLKALIAQASAMGIAIPDSMKAYLNSSKLSDAGNLSLGSTGSAVTMLQQFLNANGSQVAATGAGSPGNETTVFGYATKAALAKYQSNVGISPASGMFGPITRAYLKSIGF